VQKDPSQYLTAPSSPTTHLTTIDTAGSVTVSKNGESAP
jgi:hypothetical protein